MAKLAESILGQRVIHGRKVMSGRKVIYNKWGTGYILLLIELEIG